MDFVQLSLGSNRLRKVDPSPSLRLRLSLVTANCGNPISLFQRKKSPTAGHMTAFWLMRTKGGLGLERLWKRFSFLIKGGKRARRGIISIPAFDCFMWDRDSWRGKGSHSVFHTERGCTCGMPYSRGLHRLCFTKWNSHFSHLHRAEWYSRSYVLQAPPPYVQNLLLLLDPCLS